MPIAAVPPAVITAGDTVAFAWSGADYPASSGWGMAWRLVGAGVSLELAAVAAGDGFTVTATAAATGALTVPVRGLPCTLLGAAVLGEARYTVHRGGCLLQPDPATVTGDLRGHAARVLEAIEALLEGRASTDQQSYRIGDRELSRIEVPHLLALRDYYKAEARREADAEAAAQGRARRPRMLRMAMSRA